MKYLIVADCPRFRKHLKEFLSDKNNQCVELNNGLQLNSVYKEFKPDWILIDILLENVYVLNALENLKKEFPEARFVLLSAYSNEWLKNKPVEQNTAALISKDNLFEMIEKIQLKQMETIK